MPASKKFTARSVPALLALASERGLFAHKVDSKTYQFAPVSLHGDNFGLVGLSCDDMDAMERFAVEVGRDFASYDIDVEPRGRFVSVTWAKRVALSESVLNNCD